MIRIKVADVVFGIELMYSYTAWLCRDYATDEDADEVIAVTQEDIEYERFLSRRQIEEEGLPGALFSDEYLESLAVYRRIAECMALKGGCVFHGALIERGGNGYLFIAKSGTGKTTHILNWLEQYPDTVVINGDKPILRLVGDHIVGYGTPWCGKEQLGVNCSVKLKAIISLSRADENTIERADSRELLPVLMQQMYTPRGSGGMKRSLYMAMELAKRTELYRLGCNMEQSSAVVSYEGMN